MSGYYTKRNFQAVVEALVPRTPELGATHGEEHVPGGRDIALEEYLIEAFDGYQEHHHGRLSKLLRRLGIRNYPYAVVVALLLDVVALELVVRRWNDEAVYATRRRILYWLGGTLLVAAALGVVAGFGPVYAVMTSAVGFGFLWTVVEQFEVGSHRAAYRSFHASNAFLGALLIAVLVETLVI